MISKKQEKFLLELIEDLNEVANIHGVDGIEIDGINKLTKKQAGYFITYSLNLNEDIRFLMNKIQDLNKKLLKSQEEEKRFEFYITLKSTYVENFKKFFKYADNNLIESVNLKGSVILQENGKFKYYIEDNNIMVIEGQEMEIKDDKSSLKAFLETIEEDIASNIKTEDERNKIVLG